MENKDILAEEFKKFNLEEQIKIINRGIQKEGTLKKACEKIGINSKHWSEKFRNAGYVFSKVDKGFFKNDDIKQPKETKNESKKEIKEALETEQHPTTEVKKTVNASKKSGAFVKSSFDFYYQSTGNNKKMGASVDTEVYKQFEKLCNKYNFINVSAHVSNALALYIETLENQE